MIRQTQANRPGAESDDIMKREASLVKVSRLLIAVAVTGMMSLASLAQDAATQGQPSSGAQTGQGQTGGQASSGGQAPSGAQASSGAAAGQSSGAQKNWKDRNEYDLYVSIKKETDN